MCSTAHPILLSQWTQEIVWQIVNDIDLETVKNKTGDERVPFLEIGGLGTDKDLHRRSTRPYLKDPVTFADNLPTDKPRVIKSHLTFEMLPPNLLDTCKVVYVCRNPKDTIVSFYKVCNLATLLKQSHKFLDSTLSTRCTSS